jgi:hypothetical protein
MPDLSGLKMRKECHAQSWQGLMNPVANESAGLRAPTSSPPRLRHLHPSPRAQSSKDFIVFKPCSVFHILHKLHTYPDLTLRGLYRKLCLLARNRRPPPLSPDEPESRKTMCDVPMEVTESSALESFTSVDRPIERRWIDKEEGKRNGFR